MPQVPTESGQDWAPSNVGRGGPKAYSVPKTSRGLDWAKQTGMVATEKRYGAGGNTSKITSSNMNARKLEDATEAGKIAKVDKNLSKAISQARQALKMTQKELATAVEVKPQVIAEYENGKAIPNPQIIGKLERKLKTKLPRSGKSKIPAAGGKGGTSGAGGKPKAQSVTRGGPTKRR